MDSCLNKSLPPTRIFLIPNRNPEMSTVDSYKSQTLA